MADFCNGVGNIDFGELAAFREGLKADFRDVARNVIRLHILSEGESPQNGSSEQNSVLIMKNRIFGVHLDCGE